MQLAGWRKRRDKERPKRSPGLETDCDLAARVAEGDREALERLVDRHLGPLYRYLMRLLGPGQEQAAHEIAVATWEAAMRGMRPYARGTATMPMKLWLIRLANRQMSKRRKQVEAILREGNGESEELAFLRRASAELSVQERAALALTLFEAIPPEETAGAIGLRPGQALGVLRSALRRVDKALLAQMREEK